MARSTAFVGPRGARWPPPEPLRWAGITLTRHAMEKRARTGRRGPWLRTLDRLGLGFDS